MIGAHDGSELGAEITTLKQLIDFPDVILKVISLGGFYPLLTLTVAQAIILCLQIIDPQGRKFPKTLPRGMSQKVSIGTDVANAVKVRSPALRTSRPL